jgi:hypothetical protein
VADVFARSTTINGDPGTLEEGIAYVRDQVMPMLVTMDGCMGMSMLVDRESGQCIATSSWRDEETMRASWDNVEPMRARASELMRGEPTVEEWEVAIMHRDHQAPMGACCRVTWSRRPDRNAEEGVELYRTGVLPQIEALDGFCSASLLINRETGMACGTVTFETDAQMESSRVAARAIREGAARDGMIEILDVREFDLAVAHLGLPELV